MWLTLKPPSTVVLKAGLGQLQNDPRKGGVCVRAIGGRGGGVGVREKARVRVRLNWEAPKCPSQQHTTALMMMMMPFIYSYINKK